MVIGKSKDPVFIKKISLRIWNLRDEVKAIVQERMGQSEIPEGINIGDLLDEYHGVEHKDNVIPLKPAEASPPAQTADGTTPPVAAQATPEKESDKIIVPQRRPLLTPEQMYNAKTLLSEIDMEKIFLFSEKKFIEGQSIVIEFLIPSKFVLNADVLYCHEYNMKSRIISESKLSYRVAAKFTFLKKGERALLRKFVQSIEPDLSKGKKKKDPAEDLGV